MSAAAVHATNFVFLKVNFMEWQIPLRANLELYNYQFFCWFLNSCVQSLNTWQICIKGMDTSSLCTCDGHHVSSPLSGESGPEHCTFWTPGSTQTWLSIVSMWYKIHFLFLVSSQYSFTLSGKGKQTAMCWPLYVVVLSRWKQTRNGTELRSGQRPYLSHSPLCF